MKPLRYGLSGPDVYQWQLFLKEQTLLPCQADGRFGDATRAATIQFQSLHSLDADGVVGNRTLEVARVLGFGPQATVALPEFPALSSNAARQAIFGKFNYEAKPLPGNPENIQILGSWQLDNIVSVGIPELIGVAGAPHDGRIWFHKLAAPQMAALWTEWDQAGLLNHVLSWGGSFVPRFVRGSRSVLSNHSFGSAFDINMAQNRLGAEPALPGEAGCVRELVPIAHKHGFYWGGHFSRRDGMHFEIAILK